MPNAAPSVPRDREPGTGTIVGSTRRVVAESMEKLRGPDRREGLPASGLAWLLLLPRGRPNDRPGDPNQGHSRLDPSRMPYLLGRSFAVQLDHILGLDDEDQGWIIVVVREPGHDHQAALPQTHSQRLPQLPVSEPAVSLEHQVSDSIL